MSRLPFNRLRFPPAVWYPAARLDRPPGRPLNQFPLRGALLKAPNSHIDPPPNGMPAVCWPACSEPALDPPGPGSSLVDASREPMQRGRFAYLIALFTCPTSPAPLASPLDSKRRGPTMGRLPRPGPRHSHLRSAEPGPDQRGPEQHPVGQWSRGNNKRSYKTSRLSITNC